MKQNVIKNVLKEKKKQNVIQTFFVAQKREELIVNHIFVVVLNSFEVIGLLNLVNGGG